MYISIEATPITNKRNICWCNSRNHAAERNWKHQSLNRWNRSASIGLNFTVSITNKCTEKVYMSMLVMHQPNNYQVWFSLVCRMDVVSSTFWPIILVFRRPGFACMPRRMREYAWISDVQQSEQGPRDIFQTYQRLITRGKVNSTRFGFDLRC